MTPADRSPAARAAVASWSIVPSPEEDRLERRRDQDRFRIALPFRHGRPHPGNAAGNIGGVIAPRDPAGAEAGQAVHGTAVDRAAHPDRDTAGLARLGHLVNPVEPDLRVCVIHPIAGPQGLADGEIAVQLAPTPGEVASGGLIFLALPADADAELQPPAGQHVDGRRGLGQQDRTAQRRQQNAGREPHVRWSPR